MGKFSFIIVLSSLLFIPVLVATSLAEKRIALVIGNKRLYICTIIKPNE